jgi:hypothetical protein
MAFEPTFPDVCPTVFTTVAITNLLLSEISSATFE